MNRLLNAEEVLDLMLNSISLSRYDQKFFYNLQLQNVLPRRPITSNQAALFTKVVKKYNKQLATIQYDADHLAELPWTLKVIQSSPEFTHAIISIEGNELILRCPFKQAFVQEYRELSVMLWNREEKLYHTEFGLHKLKIIISCVCKHYTEVRFCPTVQKIINEVSSFDEDACWDPTLVKRNNRLYIFNLNESLEKAIHYVELNTDLPTLALLSSHGIKIDDSLYNELLIIYSKDDLDFALSRKIIHEVTDISGLADKLKKINCDYVLHSSIHQTVESDNYHKKLASHVDFPVQSTNIRNLSLEFNEFKMPVMVRAMSAYSFAGSGSYYAAKIINLVNSNPIEIK